MRFLFPALIIILLGCAHNPPLERKPAQIVSPALNLSALTGAEITLLRVVRPAVPPVFAVERQPFSDMGQEMIKQSEDEFERRREAAEQYLTDMATEIREHDRLVRTRVEVDDLPVAAILHEVKGVDLVALATHGRSGLSRLFLGSVADKLIRGTPVPVLVYRPKEG